MKEFMQNFILPITEMSQVAEARRLAATLARRIGFDETETGKVAIVVTEVTGNLVKHTTHGGELLLRVIESGNVAGIEILALDKGPGLKIFDRRNPGSRVWSNPTSFFNIRCPLSIGKRDSTACTHMAACLAEKGIASWAGDRRYQCAQVR
jgi:anti-sigma regulatory factor (Ser/Thr protein kinase)